MNINTESLINEAKRVFDEEIFSLRSFVGRINENFILAVEHIYYTKKLIVTGVGKSGIIAQKIAATFSSLGKPSFFLHPVESLHGDIGTVEKGDVVILLSKSGSTEEITRLVPYLKGRGAFTISLVGNMNSYLSRNTDISIDCSVEREACYLDIAPTSSTTLVLAVGDALASCYMKLKGMTIEDFSRQHPLGQIGRNITLQVKDVMHKNSNLPIIRQDSGFRNAIIEISEKGLGCVCVSDNDGMLAGIITDGDVRRALQNHEEINGLTAKEIMTKTPVRISEDAFLGEALAIMEQRNSQIAVLPVIDQGGKITGIIRIHDIIRSGI